MYVTEPSVSLVLENFCSSILLYIGKIYSFCICVFSSSVNFRLSNFFVVSILFGILFAYSIPNFCESSCKLLFSIAIYGFEILSDCIPYISSYTLNLNGNLTVSE